MSSGHRAISQASRLKRTTRNLVSLRIGTWSHDGCLCSLFRLAKVHSKVPSSGIILTARLLVRANRPLSAAA